MVLSITCLPAISATGKPAVCGHRGGVHHVLSSSRVEHATPACCACGISSGPQSNLRTEIQCSQTGVISRMGSTFLTGSSLYVPLQQFRDQQRRQCTVFAQSADVEESVNQGSLSTKFLEKPARPQLSAKPSLQIRPKPAAVPPPASPPALPSLERGDEGSQQATNGNSRPVANGRSVRGENKPFSAVWRPGQGQGAGAQREKPKFNFKPREAVLSSVAGASAELNTGASVQSLREILEKAERMRAGTNVKDTSNSSSSSLAQGTDVKDVTLDSAVASNSSSDEDGFTLFKAIDLVDDVQTSDPSTPPEDSKPSEVATPVAPPTAETAVPLAGPPTSTPVVRQEEEAKPKPVRPIAPVLKLRPSGPVSRFSDESRARKTSEDARAAVSSTAWQRPTGDRVPQESLSSEVDLVEAGEEIETTPEDDLVEKAPEVEKPPEVEMQVKPIRAETPVRLSPGPSLRAAPQAPSTPRQGFRPRAPGSSDGSPTPSGDDANSAKARLGFRTKGEVETSEASPAGAPPARRTMRPSQGGSAPNKPAIDAKVAASPKTAGRPTREGATKDSWKSKAAVEDARKRKTSSSRSRSESMDVGEVLIKRRGSKATRKAARAEAARAAAPVRAEILEVGKGGMSVADLAAQLALNDSDVVRSLFMKGIAVTVNQTLDEAAVRQVCEEYEVEVIEAGTVRVEDLAKKTIGFYEEEDADSLVLRPPVVTIMGHVDHGKTSLLDFIRESKVAAGEAGGITQGIGAYRVNVNVGGAEQQCVFLDTPGHEAFSAMRARGARVTDVAIIVVAADDGVRPQTLEAVAHARAANVPIAIAINKIDKPGANADRVMQELSGHGLMPEEWGGEVPMVPVSAHTGENIAQLLEAVMLLAEFQELKANPDSSAAGTVIEASLDRARGPVATLLVQNGTLHKGDIILSGEAYGKVRALVDDTGTRDDSAGPSMAVEILGLSTVPVAGDEFRTVASLDEARQLAEEHGQQMREERLAAQGGEGKVTLASLANAVAAGTNTGADGAPPGIEHHQLNYLLKVDVQGSLEAIRGALETLPQDTVNLRCLLQAPGEISGSDIDLAVASRAIVLGFNVSASAAVEAQAEVAGVEIRKYKVIYDLLDDMRKAMEGMLETVEERMSVGQAEVRAVFGAGSNKVAGCMVTEGRLLKGCGVAVRRGSKEVFRGKLASLRRVKELAKEVVAGLECGVGVEDFTDWAEGDIIEAYNIVVKDRTLEDASKDSEAALAAKASSFAAVASASPSPAPGARPTPVSSSSNRR